VLINLGDEIFRQTDRHDTTLCVNFTYFVCVTHRKQLGWGMSDASRQEASVTCCHRYRFTHCAVSPFYILSGSWSNQLIVVRMSHGYDDV
jgi:hypothetical protein